MAVDHTIPLIDISPFLSSSPSDSSSQEVAKKKVISAVRDACQTYGFFQLAGHGIPLADQQAVLQCAKQFFDLPYEEKWALRMENALGKCGRGYEKIGGQTLQKDARPDLKEGIYFGREIPASDPRAGQFLQGPNQWPTSLASDQFARPIMSYREKLLDLACVLMHILALGLPYGPGIFETFVEDPVGNVRLLHYPPQENTDDELQLGAGAHTDFGCLTLLLQQPNQEGLQVLYPPTGSWLPVPARENIFIVNVGDLLDGWTKGQYRSAVHRVLNRGQSHRYSVPFFFNGNLAYKLAPLDGSDDARAITVEEHIKRKFNESYAAKG